MIARILTVFAVCFLVLLVALLLAALAFFKVTNVDPSGKGIANLLGILAFVAAIAVAISPRVHLILGGSIGPIGFRRCLSESRLVVCVGIAVIAIAIELALYMFSSWYVTGTVMMLSLPRLALLVVLHGFIAWFVLIESIKKMRHVV